MPRATRNIAIVSREADLHAHLVAAELRRLSDVRVHLIWSDALSGRSELAWFSHGSAASIACDHDGMAVDPRALSVIWWRRSSTTQPNAEAHSDPAIGDLINRDCAAALVGILEATFDGVWVSRPAATAHAENKVVQLKTALACGMTIPDTLITSDPERVRQLAHRQSGGVVVKALRGASSFTVPARRLTEEDLGRDDAIRMAPAIYQAYVPGTRHVRAHCFGDRVRAVAFDSNDLDWRQRLPGRVVPYRLPDDVERGVLATLDALGLRFGVCDLKETPDGRVFWLEVNPQGQFAFLDGLHAGLRLTNHFAVYLRDLAHGERSRVAPRQ